MVHRNFEIWFSDNGNHVQVVVQPTQRTADNLERVLYVCCIGNQSDHVAAKMVRHGMQEQLDKAICNLAKKAYEKGHEHATKGRKRKFRHFTSNLSFNDIGWD